VPRYLLRGVGCRCGLVACKPEADGGGRGMTIRVLTWHVHGSYLYYLSQAPVELIVPVKDGRPEGYGGRAGHFPWPANLVEVPAEEVKRIAFDVVLFQSR